MKHNPTKITLSSEELDLVSNAQILLTKNEIIKKVYSLFGVIAEEYVETAKLMLAEPQELTAPKISRGENYLGLPLRNAGLPS
jgi:hypothetical protein